jgi:hypothetical protein
VVLAASAAGAGRRHDRHSGCGEHPLRQYPWIPGSAKRIPDYGKEIPGSGTAKTREMVHQRIDITLFYRRSRDRDGKFPG